jgi:hypothetical protein
MHTNDSKIGNLEKVCMYIFNIIKYYKLKLEV